MIDNGQPKDAGLSRERVSAWVNTLPFPLAATLHLYRTRRDDADRFDSLLHFYEGASELLAAVLAAPALDDDAFLSTFQADAAKALAGLERATFGHWVFLGGLLADALRSLDDERVASLLEIGEPERVAAVQDAALWKHLSNANGLRNKYAGHGAMAAPGQVRRQLAEVEASLAPVADRLVAIFDGWTLVRPGLLALRGGRFHNRVDVLVGPNPQFDQDELVLDEGLEEGCLYLVEHGARRALQVPPVVRVVTEEDRGLHVAYFYSKITGARAEWISRHLGGVPTLKEDSAGILEFISRLQRHAASDDVAAAPASPDRGGSVPPAADTVTEESGQESGAAGGDRAQEPSAPAVDLPIEPHAGSPVPTEPGPSDTRPSADRVPAAQDPEPATAGAARRGRAAGITGRRLAVAAHEAARATDPDRRGLSAADVVALLAQSGTVIASPDPARAAWDSMNASHDLFERGGRSRFVWRLDPMPVGGLSGRELVDAAAADADWMRGDGAGRKYGEIIERLEALGLVVIGPDKGRTVRAAMGTAYGRRRFDVVGPARYVPARSLPGDGRGIKAATTAREAKLEAFWRLAVPLASARNPMFDAMRPRPYPFVTRSVGGITYRMNIKTKDASVWVVFGGQDAAKRRARFERLLSNAGAVEGVFGAPLAWETSSLEPFVWSKASKAGLDDEGRWGQTAAELADALVRLSAAVAPFI